jgi:hypothetical protein
VRLGHAFQGWSLDDAATLADSGLGTPLASFFALDASAINTLFAADTLSTTTLYAVWAPRTDSSLAFDANGGTPGDVASITGLTFGLSIADNAKALPTVAPDAPVRAHHSFLGWSSVSGEGTVVDFTDASVVSWEGMRTVYALWQLDTHSLLPTTLRMPPRGSCPPRASIPMVPPPP